MARAFCALSVALLAALIAVSVALTVSNSRTAAVPTVTPVAPAVAPKFSIAREAFGQYTRVLIRNEGILHFAFCFALDVYFAFCILLCS